MKIEKAIEILELECTSRKLKSDPDYLASAKLGIEALKRQQQLRLSKITWFRGLLPGETQ